VEFLRRIFSALHQRKVEVFVKLLANGFVKAVPIIHQWPNVGLSGLRLLGRQI
jgi:hypothetical protein